MYSEKGKSNIKLLIEMLGKSFIMMYVYDELFEKEEHYSGAYLYTVSYMFWNYNIYILSIIFIIENVFPTALKYSPQKIMLWFMVIFKTILILYFFSMVYFFIYEHFFKILQDNFSMMIKNYSLAYVLIKYPLYKISKTNTQSNILNDN